MIASWKSHFWTFSLFGQFSRLNNIQACTFLIQSSVMRWSEDRSGVGGFSAPRGRGSVRHWLFFHARRAQIGQELVVFPRPEGADRSGAGGFSAPRGRRSVRRWWFFRAQRAQIGQALVFYFGLVVRRWKSKKQLSSETQTELFSRKRLLKYDENGFCRKTAVGVQVSTVQT